MTSASPPQPDAAATPELYRATSLLSIWGPCRRVGDEYLSCVVLSGMGMCKPLRRTFEQCAAETAEYSTSVLDQLASQACGHVEDSNPAAKRNCAAEILLMQQQMQQRPPQQGPQMQ
ncbi:expressed unknown protein [Seminavis robusta]|uniref:Uncharacterized protein n=1 Tax=Seminavis robusta TaxID=568900 RepID=A0A9N8F0W5_9STRA|nr:expressed unknown protein [Seminavis robusta]|eukprot:Sro2902_g339820.1 n/a (117) ;mRNA; f:1151-1501